MYKVRKSFACFALAVSVLMVSACPRHQVLVLLRDAAAANQSFQKGIKIAYDAGHIAPDRYISLQEGIKKVAQLDDAAISFAEAGADKSALGQVDLAIAQIDDLINNGLLGVKDNDSRLALHIILTGFRTTLVTAKAMLTK
jgi:hypothetical protein